MFEMIWGKSTKIFDLETVFILKEKYSIKALKKVLKIN